jgi:hypothetical protein
MSEQPNQQPVKHIHRHQLELGENAFWFLIWSLAAASLLGLVWIANFWNNRTDELIARTPDPIETRCAISGGSTVTQQCMALLTKRGN